MHALLQDEDESPPGTAGDEPSDVLESLGGSDSEAPAKKKKKTGGRGQGVQGRGGGRAGQAGRGRSIQNVSRQQLRCMSACLFDEHFGFWL